jgi:hypothetical protein
VVDYLLETSEHKLMGVPSYNPVVLLRDGRACLLNT